MTELEAATGAGKAMSDDKCGSSTTKCPKVTRVRVDFRPKDDWGGKFGFDWMRIGGKAERAGEHVYKEKIKSGYNGLAKVAAYKAMKSEYDTIATEIKAPPENLKEYFVPYLHLYPKGTTGTPTPPFEAELKVLVEVEEAAPDKLEFEYDKKLFQLDKTELKDKAIGAKRIASDKTVKITCLAAFTADQEIKVWSTLGEKKTLAGQLKLPRNDKTVQKRLKVVLVKVRTKITSVVRIGSFTAAEKELLRDVLFQALIQCEMEDGPDLDLTADDNMRISTVKGKKKYGAFIYRKKATDKAGERVDGLYEDYGGEPGEAAVDGAGNFFAYLRQKFLAEPANAKYDEYFTVFAFNEVPYDVTTLGQAEDIGVHNAAMFVPTGGRDNETLAHEVLHGLKLKHTHDSEGADNKYIFEDNTTDNIMSYNTNLCSTWRWQWDIMRSDL